MNEQRTNAHKDNGREKNGHLSEERQAKKHVRRRGGKADENIAIGIALGLPIGAGIGFVIGIITDNVFFWFPIFAGIGMIVGVIGGVIADTRTRG